LPRFAASGFRSRAPFQIAIITSAETGTFDQTPFGIGTRSPRKFGT